MNNLSSLESLMVKQTCRFFSYKPEMGPNQSPEDPTNIYSQKFLKALYDSPKENINNVIKSTLVVNESDKLKDAFDDNDNEKYNLIEKRILLDFFEKLVDMKSQPSKQWTDLQHYLCFVYRYCMTSDPDPEQQILSPYFVADMRCMVCCLMDDDQVQLCLRLFSLVREYTMFAQKQHQKINNVESSIESLFYYYEAFLSATKNICKIFPELEKLLLGIYKLGWLDFNTSIFMYYFYETPYVQNVVRKFELMKDNVSIKAAGIYTVLTELHKLWRSQMLGINGIIANKLGVKFKGLDNKTMLNHKKILSNNFWLDRSTDEKAIQDMAVFDYQLFTLVGNKSLTLPEPTLDETGQCICDDCLIIKYKSLLENSQNKISTGSIKVSCRFCRQQVDLDNFQQHVNGRALPGTDGTNKCKNVCKIISDNFNIAKLGLSAKVSTITASNHVKRQKQHQSGNPVSKNPIPKIANEPPPIFDDDDVDITEMTCQEIDSSKMSRKTFYNFLKYRQSLARTDTSNGKSEDAPKINSKQSSTPTVKAAPTKPEESNSSKSIDIKNLKGTTCTSNKNSGANFPCGHSCKLEEELMKSEFKKAYQDTCDHHKESKKCDCTFCEVFGTTTSHVHKTNETRNRLRIRLNQRNEKVGGKATSKKNANLNVNSAITKPPPKKPEPTPQPKISAPVSEVMTSAKVEEQKTNSLMRDIHGLLNFIEGNTNGDKVALAEKKAAKKARQKNKKEEERLQIEEEERRKVAEEKRKAEEKLRSEELAKQIAERAKNSKKENKKKKKQKQKSKREAANADSMEETIPAMVTIKRVVENDHSLPTVTITLKGSTPDQDKLLYTLVNGHDGKNETTNEKKNKKNSNKNQHDLMSTVSLEVNSKNNNSNNTNSKKKKNNNKNEMQGQQTNTVFTKELRVTLAVDPVSIPTNDGNNKRNKNNSTNNKMPEVKHSRKQESSNINSKKEKKISICKDSDFNIPMLRLPPGITITKVDGPVTDRHYKATSLENQPYNSTSIPVSKSGVIVVDTEKLIKQSSTVTVQPTTGGKKSRKKKKKQQELQKDQHVQNNKSSMVTLKNPIFQNMQNTRHEPEITIPDIASGQCQQAAIFKNENGMVTIRSSRLQQSLSSGSTIPNLLSDLKPVLGPEVPTTYMSSCNFSESSRISPFNAQEILSGLPGIEITKVDKNATRNEIDHKKSCHTAEVSIIPTSNGGDKFSFDKDDLHYDNVFTPKDILEDDMDADERELEAFKRFCQQSVPPERKEKVAHLNVKDIVLKKKNNKVSA